MKTGEVLLMWKMYDELIAGIPDGLIVDEYLPANHFCLLQSGDLCGLAHATRGHSRPAAFPDGVAGRPLKEVAQLAKSWNLEDATMGMAAINAWYNSKENLSSYGIEINSGEDISMKERKEKHPLAGHPEKLRGKKVALIGHFRNVEEKLDGFADMYILERNPSEGDYPDSACEYLLPEMDFIYATGMTLINKTAKRLLQLKNEVAYFTFMGPTTTLSPVLLHSGADSLASFVVTDPEYVRDVIANGRHGMFAGGMMVDLNLTDFGNGFMQKELPV